MSDVFTGGPDESSMSLGFGPDPQREAPDNQGQGTPAGQVVLTQEQFQELIGRIGQQHQELDYAAAIAGQPVEPLPDIDLDQLPDPRVDYEGFKRGLSEGLTNARNHVLQVAQTQVDAAQQQRDLLDDAWALLRTRHPDVAQHEEIIAMAASREMDELRGRGIDPLAILAQNMEAGVDRIAERAGATIGRIKGLQGGDSDPGDRTSMIGGGSPRPARGAPRQEQPSNFIDELKTEQRRLGIY